MASKKQRAANRANAKSSSGPKSAEGKARSSLNSWKHGLTAERIVIAGEDPAEFETLREELREHWKPYGVTECALVERLAVLTWRLNRVPGFEAAVLDARESQIKEPQKQSRDRREEIIAKFSRASAEHNAQLAEQGLPPPTPSQQLADMYHYFSERHRLAEEAVQAEPVRSDIGLALILDSEKSDALGKVLRYENTLTNGLARTLSILISLQTSRKAHEEVSKEIAVAPT